MEERKINFTKSVLDALPVPEVGKRAEYWDTKQPGLQIRITGTGAKSFYVKHRVKGGGVERVSLGAYPKITIEQARKRAAEIVAGMVNGKSATEGLKAGKKETTLGELFKDFLKNRRNRRGAHLSEKTKLNYESDFSRYFGKLEKKRLSEIKETVIAKLHSSIGETAPYGANRALALISSLYSYAKDRKLFVGQNPASGIKKFPEDSRDRFIQADELPRFFQALAEEENETIRDYVLLSLLTGARRSNVLSMQWKDINLDRGEWRLLTTKNGTPQTVTLSPEAIDVLRNRKPAEDDEEASKFVFPGDGETGHLTEPKKGWKRILDRSGISDLRIHDLRRTLGSWQAKTGASLSIIGKSLNHKNTSTTAIYARLDLDPVRESVNTATSAMMAAAGLKEAAEVVKLKAKG
ncbi:MAG TPA: tyrosine-type recombinase/integrase [Burkholderiales bacterium]|nr:tyrosine-type recombinase/integrase [Burkholderiales bacterium]